MELVSTAYNTLPIVILVSAAAIFLKETLIKFLSFEFVKQTLKIFLGLTPRETGEILLLQVKHIAIILKTSAELVLRSFYIFVQTVQQLVPEQITRILGVLFNTSIDILTNRTEIEFFTTVLTNLIYGIGYGIKLLLYLIPEVLTFLQTIGNIFYNIGQGFYVILASFNKMVDMILNTWNWFQDPPVHGRIVIIVAILFLSVGFGIIVKSIQWMKKKIN